MSEGERTERRKGGGIFMKEEIINRLRDREMGSINCSRCGKLMKKRPKKAE